MERQKRDDLRNIAIIAHVDHGKTTLVDKMLRDSGTVQLEESQDRVMDVGELERERGITILAKNTSVRLPGCKINIVDTPGHMDFGGEVERTLQMVEGFLLLVDAAEGVLPGTRFVLQKALELNLKPLVLINKVDRKDADIEKTENQVQDLFLELALDTAQLDFPILYGSSKLGFVSTNPTDTSGSMKPLFDAIIESVPAPTQTLPNTQFLITNLEYSDYLGRIGIGKLFNGSLSLGQEVVCCTDDKVSRKMRVTKIYNFEGLERAEVDSAQFGDIIAVAGFENELSIGTTICSADNPLPIKYVKIDEPTLSIYLSVNNSPFFGQEGKFLTSRQLRDRLYKELKTNVAMRVEDTPWPDTLKVFGRGQLHLSILIETMRREGYEFSVSAPEVIYKKVNGEKLEPFELLILDINEEHQGVIIEVLGRRKALMQSLTPYGEGKVRLEFKIPTRGLIGFRSIFVTETRGSGRMNHQFLDYEPYAGVIPKRNKGSILSMENGKVTAYALNGIEPRGVLFIGPGTAVYEGMIVGEHNRENDLEVNPTRQKKLTNMRASGSDESVILAPPRQLSLEECLDWIGDDELIEVTPKSIRLRKRYLKAHERKKAK